MESHPEFLPGFIDVTEVEKDRALRTQMILIAGELDNLSRQVDDTLTIVASEIWMADLAYYQSVREATKRNLPGAQDIQDDLSQRFPGSAKSAVTPALSPATRLIAAAHS